MKTYIHEKTIVSSIERMIAKYGVIAVRHAVRKWDRQQAERTKLLKEIDTIERDVAKLDKKIKENK